MALICEDLSRHGVVLLAIADDRAALVNQSKIAIAHVAYIWSLRRPGGRIITGSRSPGTQPSVLLPFTMEGLPGSFLKRYAYWNTVFPGSKRVITAAGEFLGDNTDVSTPSEDERRGGGYMRVSSGRRYDPDTEPVKLTLDGVFFVDGSFAGPNHIGCWEHFVAARASHLNCAVQARSATTPNARAEFFETWRHLTGLRDDEPRRGSMLPPPRRPHYLPGRVDREDIRRYQQETVARKVLGMRDQRGADAAITMIAAWLDTPGPELHLL